MTSTADLLPDILYQYDFSVLVTYFDSEFVMWKGKDQIFRNYLGQVKFIHMSNDMLEGGIPEGISSLIGLVSLDLSSNKLNGSITPKIGLLTALELLDLSSNNLSGAIPATFANLNFLGMLNLSYNHLSGRIPTGTLLQGFDASAYMGNPGLCGAPLAICPGDEPPSNNTWNGNDDVAQQDVNDHNDDIFPGLYISVVLGFIIGFWGVCGTLVIKRSWRHAFFRTLDYMRDRVYVMIHRR
ncbi:probable LRR receptor-like serine/threonine-protein kinase At1g12460 [Chenopodium quinoa]|nr:probable LRR receptor-like serine/threonine-protein kinase At1g12460 [Chenopodium quinoa]